VAVKDLEGSLDLFNTCTATNVEEIGWVTSVQFNDVHGGHSQTCSVDHAANVSVQSNVVQASSNSLLFMGINLLAGN
jgi:hypothetical protein